MYSPSLISYNQTGYFSKIILDYLEQAKELEPFFSHTPDVKGIKEAIEVRKKFTANRQLLVDILKTQYTSEETSAAAEKNLELLLSPHTFTICTAHQPNIFTGHLYFIYKILHTIKVAEYLNAAIAENNFVPVFYMGSEDADLQELNHIYISGKKYEWKTNQTGAVGKMRIDEDLLNLLDEISGALKVLPFGAELSELLKSCYTKDTSIQQATFRLINYLFRDYGLIVLLPDSADLKSTMLSIFEDDIFNNTPSEIVGKTSQELSKLYKIQAQPREINLFYLKDNIRRRLIKKKDKYYAEDTDIAFTAESLRLELQDYPERFSPNVILRGLYQEMILPNLAFIGGGGELAYWLELKDLFEHYKIPFPILILRNSFMLVDKKVRKLCKKLQLETGDLFKNETVLINELVKKESTHQLYLSLEKQQIKDIYDEIKKAARRIDSTLETHSEALLVNTLKKLEALESKMLRAEKRKFEVQQRQIKKLKSILFPNGSLQERVENFMPYYARYGKEFIDVLYKNSLIFDQMFCLLSESED